MSILHSDDSLLDLYPKMTPHEAAQVLKNARFILGRSNGKAEFIRAYMKAIGLAIDILEEADQYKLICANEGILVYKKKD